jgi:hypothetical protein
MTDIEPDTSDARQVANFTVANLQRMDRKLDIMLEILHRRDARFDRIDRGMAELKCDVGELKAIVGCLKIEFSRRLTRIPVS